MNREEVIHKIARAMTTSIFEDDEAWYWIYNTIIHGINNELTLNSMTDDELNDKLEEWVTTQY